MNGEENILVVSKLQTNIKNSTQSYFLFSVLTVINTIITLIGFGLSFSFSAFIPCLQSELAVLFRDEVKQTEIANIFLALSLIFCFIFLVSSVIALKKPKFLIFGLVITSLDSVVMIIFIVNNLNSIMTSLLVYSVYILFHAWIMYYLINGVVSLKKIKSLSEMNENNSNESEE